MKRGPGMARRPALPLLAPRLLPLTMCCLAALLVVKSVSLVRAATAAGTATASAPSFVQAAAEAAPERPAAAPAPIPDPTLATAPATPPAARAPARQMSAMAAPVERAGLPSSAPSSNPDPLSGGPPISDSERAVLLELRARRQQLEAREQALAAREAVLAATDKKLSERVAELKALQTRLEALEAGRRERDEVSWRGLVKVYETMKPRDAATIMNELDLPVLLAVIDRMKEAKTAPILAAMQPDRARQVTAELALQRQRANAINRTGG
jgi:flagellar motility protein MotE (MotC chaperone)